MPPEQHPGRNDGEPIGSGRIAQPVAAGSSAAYLAAGWWVWHRRQLGPNPQVAALYAFTVAGNGVGGMGFHGRGDRVSHWVHDAALCATLSVLATVEPGRAAEARAGVSAATGAAAALLVAVAPNTTNLVVAALSAAAGGQMAGAIARGHRPAPRRYLTISGTMVLALLANRSARPETSLHLPALRMSGHGWWHGLTAVALAAWGSAVLDAPSTTSDLRPAGSEGTSRRGR